MLKIQNKFETEKSAIAYLQERGWVWENRAYNAYGEPVLRHPRVPRAYRTVEKIGSCWTIYRGMDTLN